ncbi:MAG: excinuclease ABC subunit UvrB [Deltaproteobacteria bacterium]|nr:excinuclease ABC subunit UvrB [Deltaproteobacteria bacterium]
MTEIYRIESPFQPAGDQPQAIENIVNSFSRGDKHHVLLGVTGSGKTFSVAHIIARLNRSALVIAPNKTLAAQLYIELKGLFPDNAVGFFISYYDYFQPEAYVPSTDTYIAKDSAINDDIDKMRHNATQLLFEEPAAIIVASVSCIYGLGSPDTYASKVVNVAKGDTLSRNDLLRSLLAINYQRNDHNLLRGHLRVRGDIVDILPSNQTDRAVRVSFLETSVESISLVDPLTGEWREDLEEVSLYPNSHYVTDRKDMKSVINEILTDLGTKLRELKDQNRLVEAQRLEQRTMQDVEAMEQLGFCPGIENYSRYLSGKKPGEAPPCLLDYFPPDFLVIIDESHITVPQLKGMYRGDQARKQTLVHYGFRLPSALDNRPLNFNEFLERCHQVLFVSATPGPLELAMADGHISEQIIRPTGLVDPNIIVKPAKYQVDDLHTEIKRAVDLKGRVLVTTLTKRMAEDLTEYYADLGVRVKYLHADIDALERASLLRSLRLGEFDVLIGINLLREGLDLPEVLLVAVMDADKEGFLRSHRSLIQIVGRAARNSQSQVIFYADTETESMREALHETERRRQKQLAYNEAHNITPKTVVKDIPKDLRAMYGLSESLEETPEDILDTLRLQFNSASDIETAIRRKTKIMKAHAARMEFEQAAELRNEVRKLKALLLVF